MSFLEVVYFRIHSFGVWLSNTNSYLIQCCNDLWRTLRTKHGAMILLKCNFSYKELNIIYIKCTYGYCTYHHLIGTLYYKKNTSPRTDLFWGWQNHSLSFGPWSFEFELGQTLVFILKKRPGWILKAKHAEQNSIFYRSYECLMRVYKFEVNMDWALWRSSFLSFLGISSIRTFTGILYCNHIYKIFWLSEKDRNCIKIYYP